jgi:hypothetical protein
MFILINLKAIMAQRLEMCWLLNWAVFFRVYQFLFFLTIIHILLDGRVQSCTWFEYHAKGWVSKAIFFSLRHNHFNY